MQRFLDDLVGGGYDGTISIEPHVASVVHDRGSREADPEELFSSYVRYGRTLTAMVGQARRARTAT